jgi:hypothetical protein
VATKTVVDFGERANAPAVALRNPMLRTQAREKRAVGQAKCHPRRFTR